MTLELAFLLGRHPVAVFFALMLLSGGLAALAWRYIVAGSTPAGAARATRRRQVAWLAGLLALLVFAALATGLYRDGWQLAFDDTLAATLSEHASAGWLWAWSWLTVAGDRDLLIGLGAAVFLLLLWRRAWHEAALWLAGTAGAGLLNMLLKASFARARPEHTHGFAVADGWSFPSGHSTGAMAFYGMLAYLLVRHLPPRWRAAVAVASAMLVAAVGYSRIVLQVHYFSDVVAAFAITGAWILLCLGVRQAVAARASAGPRA